MVGKLEANRVCIGIFKINDNQLFMLIRRQQ